MSLPLPYENPSYIYEGLDPEQWEPSTGEVFNRVPRELLADIKVVRDYSEVLDNRILALSGTPITWNNSTGYAITNIITYSGTTYESTINNNFSVPGTDSNWVAIVPPIEQAEADIVELQNRAVGYTSDDLSSSLQATTGTNNTTLMTPLRTSELISARIGEISTEVNSDLIAESALIHALIFGA